MLKLAENYDELDFLTDNPFCAVITALARTYGFKYDFIRFYVQGKSAAISVIDGNVSIFADKDADFQELSQFLNFFSFQSVKGEKSVLEKLGLQISNSSHIVKFTGKIPEKPEGFSRDYSLKEVYDLLCKSDFELGEFSYFANDVNTRINKGTAKLGVISHSTLESCCFNLFDGDKSCLLGAVATAKSSRGKGLASKLVPFMASKEKSTFLFCREDALLKFYENCGFSQWGKWAISK